MLLKYIILTFKTFSIFPLHPYSLLKKFDLKEYITIIFILSVSIYLNIFFLVKSLLKINDYHTLKNIFITITSIQTFFLIHLLFLISIVYYCCYFKNVTRENTLKTVTTILISYVPYLYSELLLPRGETNFPKLLFFQKYVKSIIVLAYIIWPTFITWIAFIHIFNTSKIRCFLFTIQITVLKFTLHFLVLAAVFYNFNPQI